MKTICQTCGGDNIHQQASIIVEINKEIIVPNLSDFEWDDYYYCTDCEDECLIDEIAE